MKKFLEIFFKSLGLLFTFLIDWLFILPLFGGDDIEIISAIVGLIISVVVYAAIIFSFFKE